MNDCWNTNRTPVDMAAVHREAQTIANMDELNKAAESIRVEFTPWPHLEPCTESSCQQIAFMNAVADLLEVSADEARQDGLTEHNDPITETAVQAARSWLAGDS